MNSCAKHITWVFLLVVSCSDDAPHRGAHDDGSGGTSGADRTYDGASPDMGAAHDAGDVAVRDPGADADAGDASGHTDATVVSGDPVTTRATEWTCLADGADAPCRIQDEWSGLAGGGQSYLGIVFDGVRCRPAYGEACRGEECPDFGSVTECAQTCANQGWCHEELFGLSLSGDLCRVPSCINAHVACVSSDDDPSKDLDVIFPTDVGFGCEPTQERDLCWSAGTRCDEGQWCCIRNHRNPAPERIDDLRGMCALSLQVGVTMVECPALD